MKKVIWILIVILNVIFIKSVRAENEQFKVWDKVRYNGIEFHVISVSNDYLTLYSDEPIKSNELDTSSLSEYVESKDGILITPYYQSSSCHGGTSVGCTKEYESSLVKQILDIWGSQYLESSNLVADETGYKYRLITFNELKDKLYYEYYIQNISSKKYFKSPNTPNWFYNSESWTMSGITDSNSSVAFISTNGSIDEESLIMPHAIRPVINVKKEFVELLSKSTTKKEYNMASKIKCEKGDIINYNNTKFYVLRDSDEEDEYVTLVKASPLSVEEVEKYGTGFINKYTQISKGKVYNSKGYGGMAFYSSNECGYTSDDIPLTNGCINEYDNSDIKHVVDGWTKDIFKNADFGIDDYGCSSRLMNEDDLFIHLNYIRSNQYITTGGEYIKNTENTPSFNLSSCWTMIGIQDYNNFVALRGVDGYFYARDIYYYGGTVCPVITVKKVDVVNENGKSLEKVNVPDTKLRKTLITICIGLFIIGITITFILYKIKTNKKNRG